MRRITINIIFTIWILTSCTSYVWNPVSYVELENNLNNKIGMDFSEAYSNLGDGHLINETGTHMEYIYDEYADCAWIVKVVQASNKIESWRYSYPQRCEIYKKKTKYTRSDTINHPS